MGASLIVSVFLAFSLSLSWFSGDKENGMLEETIREAKSEQKMINERYQLLSVQMREKEFGQKVMAKKLKDEVKKQKKLKRTLAMEKRKLRIAVENGKAIDVDAERKRIRKEVEERASKEIARLEQKIVTVEAEKKRIEENARIGLTAKRDKDSEAWTQAELAKARAQEAISKYKALKSELENLRAARDQADGVLREQARARKNAEEALARIKAERAALEARLKAAEQTLRVAAPSGDSQSVKNDVVPPFVAEMKKARDILRREIGIRNRTITELERNAKEIERNAKLIDDNERQTLRSALEKKARRVAELEKKLEDSRVREQTLKANLKNGTTTAKAAGDSVEKARINTLRARILSLQAKLKETEDNKNAFAEKARARIDALRKRTEQLDTKNMEMEQDLREGVPLRARAMPSEEMVPRLLKKDRELQTKLLGDGLVDLRSQASNYVAQKMIDRNVELEAQLQDTRLQLAEAQNSYRNASGRGGFTDAIEINPARGDTRAIIARYRKAATTITSLNQRNIELEAAVGEKMQAVAQIEAARFIIDKLQSQNLELQKKLHALDKEKRAEEAAFAAAVAAPADLDKHEPMPVEAEAVNVETPVNITGQRALKIAVAPTKVVAATVNVEAKDALPRAVSGDEKAVPAAELGLLPAADVETTLSPEAPMIVASLEKGVDLEGAMQAIIPSVKEAKPEAPVVKSQAELEAARKASAKELRQIVNEIQDLNTSLESMRKGPGNTSLAQIHERIRKLQKKIIHDVDSGAMKMEDIMPYVDEGGGFTFYTIREGDTPNEIAGRKDVYGDPSMWPLIYRYNQSRLESPDVIQTSRLLIIYKNLPAGEKEEAIKKAHVFGEWTSWKDEDKRALVEDWIM